MSLGTVDNVMGNNYRAILCFKMFDFNMQTGEEHNSLEGILKLYAAAVVIINLRCFNGVNVKCI